MDIKSSEFISSSANISSCPQLKLPEFAFIGRSNVGKSSLINMLTNRKSLAKVSQTPGKTRLINHFKINDSWYLVDLPGYGFARIPKIEKLKLERLIYSYFLKRKNLEHTFLLVDSRLDPQSNDITFMAWLELHHVKFSLLFTKSDKLSKTRLEKNINNYRQILTEFNPNPGEIIPTSIVTHSGKEKIMQTINSFLYTTLVQ
jgi:GTP-binding protein